MTILFLRYAIDERCSNSIPRVGTVYTASRSDVQTRGSGVPVVVRVRRTRVVRVRVRGPEQLVRARLVAVQYHLSDIRPVVQRQQRRRHRRSKRSVYTLTI